MLYIVVRNQLKILSDERGKVGVGLFEKSSNKNKRSRCAESMEMEQTTMSPFNYENNTGCLECQVNIGSLLVVNLLVDEAL